MLDGLADARISAAATNVPRHRLVDIGVSGRRDLRQQRGGGHDLAGLTVAALDDLEIEPGLLDLLAGRRSADGLDGGDRMSDRSAHRHHAGSPRHAVQVHGAGAAQCDAAAELGAVHPKQVAQGPEEGHVRVRVDLVRLAVDFQSDHGLAECMSWALPSTSIKQTIETAAGAWASIAVHKSLRTSERLAPLAIISSVGFSAANRDPVRSWAESGASPESESSALAARIPSPFSAHSSSCSSAASVERTIL